MRHETVFVVGNLPEPPIVVARAASAAVLSGYSGLDQRSACSTKISTTGCGKQEETTIRTVTQNAGDH
jgi:hypothetical protein